MTSPSPITQQARLLGMCRSVVYDLPRPHSAADLALMLGIEQTVPILAA